MLQLIGWLGCIYLIVKAFEIFGSSAHRSDNGHLKGHSTVAAAIAIIGAVIFFFLFALQGSAMPEPISPYGY